MFLFCLSASFAWKTGFAHRKTITISNTNVDADLANFPVYITIVNDTNFDSCQADGDDIIFTDTEDNDLYFELLYISVGSGTEADFYVLVNPVKTASNTEIYCYYENGSATKSSYNDPTKVFDTANGWAAVWHLEESSNPYMDATASNADSTAGTYPSRATGKVGYGQNFVAASSQYISIPDNAALDFGTGDFSFSCWIKTAASGNPPIIGKNILDSPKWYFLTTDDQEYTGVVIYAGIRAGASERIVTGTTVFSRNAFHHLGWCVDRDNAAGLCGFVDGVKDGTTGDPTAANGSLDNASAIVINSDEGGWYGNGIIDELWAYKGLLSDAWYKFNFYNSHDGHAAGNELSWGSETNPPALSYVPKVIIIK